MNKKTKLCWQFIYFTIVQTISFTFRATLHVYLLCECESTKKFYKKLLKALQILGRFRQYIVANS